MPLHPQSMMFLQQAKANGTPAWHELPPEESRSIFSSFQGIFGEGPELPEVRDLDIAGVPVRLYRPVAGESLPAISYFHGGGFVLGNVETHDALCRRIAAKTKMAVVSVDYRLAPEHKYPAAIDDCFAVTKALVDDAADLNIDPRRVLVAGDSAGGNLAAAVCLRAHAEAGPPIAGQILIYPVIAPDFETASYRDLATDHGLTRETMQWFWEQYIGGVQAPHPYTDLRESVLAGMPTAHVLTAEYDVLRDEGESFAARLREAGVSATLERYDGMLHGFVHFAGFFEQGCEAVDDIAAAARAMT